MKKILLLLIVLLSCTKEITFEVPLSEPKITVNGFIENGHHAKILLTKSTDPFNISSDFLDSEFFNKHVIMDATINNSLLQQIQTVYYPNEIILNLILSFSLYSPVLIISDELISSIV